MASCWLVAPDLFEVSASFLARLLTRSLLQAQSPESGWYAYLARSCLLGTLLHV
jgi:hypothetical protein